MKKDFLDNCLQMVMVFVYKQNFQHFDYHSCPYIPSKNSTRQQKKAKLVKS